MNTPVGRFAPSPTGLLHLGNAWSFLLAWLAARAEGGRILRLRRGQPRGLHRRFRHPAGQRLHHRQRIRGFPVRRSPCPRPAEKRRRLHCARQGQSDPERRPCRR
ncbi:glutamate--tRNA ligase family protein, partial [Mailhella massiliensis]|uniref:glutamate--tRNA ligase family protein n=1 Tax=Mailhella massiliensis TaxID=1903261 RepID=UPI003B8489E5